MCAELAAFTALYRAGASVFTAFASIALLLAVVGVHGVKSYVVSRRTREFGIRVATGAHPRALVWQVLREGSRFTIIGIGIGVLLALGAGRLYSGFPVRGRCRGAPRSGGGTTDPAGLAARGHLRPGALRHDWIRDAEQYDDLAFIVMKVR